MASNKNQHFVPRCYLKPFTVGEGGKAVHLYNLDRSQPIRGAPVKGQCSRDYFYGEDLILERRLQAFEGEYATLLTEVRKPGYRLTDDHQRALKRFWLLQYLRTEAASLRLAQMFADLEADVGELPADYHLSIKRAVETTMKLFFEAGDTVDDLSACLVRNPTGAPFVTSDNPAVMTNRWHLTDPRAKGISPGIGNAGAIGLLPLASDILLLLYDRALHTVLHNQGWVVAGLNDVDAFNEHQAMNCNANLYFRDWERSDDIAVAIPRWITQRPKIRHRIHHMIFDRREGDADVYRVVPAAEARNQSGMIHTEAITSPPSRWPSLLKWRAGGYVYDSGTGEGFLRREGLDPTPRYRKIRVR